MEDGKFDVMKIFDFLSNPASTKNVKESVMSSAKFVPTNVVQSDVFDMVWSTEPKRTVFTIAPA